MSQSDIEYYRQRAKSERERAKQSSRADIAEIHEELARLYEALIQHEQLRPQMHEMHVVSSDRQSVSA